MIKPEVIKELYTKYPEPGNNSNNLNLELFKNENLKQHNVHINEDSIIIYSVEEDSPFREIPIRNIKGIEEFNNHAVIILRNSILFLNKSNKDIHVHINFERPSMWQRLKYMFRNDYK